VAKALRAAFVQLTPSEMKKRVASKLHDNLTQVERMEREAQWLKLHGSPLRVLGLPEHADLTDVRARYKDLLFETHPDTAVAAARRAGIPDPLALTPGTGGASPKDLVAAEGLTDEQVRQRAVERFELLVAAHKMATDPTSVWHKNHCAPQIYEALEPPTRMSAIANPTTAFGSIALAIACFCFAVFTFQFLPKACEAALELYDPRFFRFMLAQEKADAALRAEGIEPEPDRYMPREVVKYKAPGRLIDTEGVDDLNWKPKSNG